MNEITYESVTSGHVDALAHDGEDSLYVRFKSGDEYAYHGVSFSEFESIKESSSIGRSLNALSVKGVRC